MDGAVRGYRDSIRPSPHRLPPRPAMRARSDNYPLTAIPAPCR